MTTRKKLDPANAAKVRRLNAEDFAAIRMTAREALHPYDFGPAPDANSRTTLEEFMEGWEESFPFAQADLLDKWQVNTLHAEAFNHYIDRTKLNVPGF